MTTLFVIQLGRNCGPKYTKQGKTCTDRRSSSIILLRKNLAGVRVVVIPEQKLLEVLPVREVRQVEVEGKYENRGVHEGLVADVSEFVVQDHERDHVADWEASGVHSLPSIVNRELLRRGIGCEAQVVRSLNRDSKFRFDARQDLVEECNAS